MSVNPIFKGLGCSIPEPDAPKALSDVGLDPAKRTDIENRINQLRNILDATAGGNTTKRQLEEAAIRKVMLDNMQRSQEVVKVVALNPDAGRGFAKFLATDLGVSRNWLGLGDAYTSAGWVRESMARMRRAWSGGIERGLRELGAVEKAAELYKPLRADLKKLGIGQEDIDYILTTSHEQGWYNHIMQAAPPGRQGQLVLAGRVNNFRKELADSYGLSNDLIARVQDSGRQIAQVEHDIAEIAFTAGVDMNRERLLNNMPRYLSDEAKMRFNWKFDDAKKGQVILDNGTNDTISNILYKSRVSHDFVVEDEIVLDYILRHISQQKYQSPSHLYETATNTPGAGIADILDNHHALSRTFLDLEPEVLDNLVDSGLVSKLPMPSADLLKELGRVYDFPFKGLKEVFAVDWERGMKVYKEQLTRMAQKSGYVNQLVKSAIDGNWGVPKSVVMNDTTGAYKGFVPLVDYQGKSGVLPKELLTQAGFSASRQRELGLMLENTYLHPTVAALAKANLALQIDPNAMGVYARFSHEVGTKFRALAVSSLEYIPRQFWNTIVSQHAGQGNILSVAKYAYSTALSQASGKPMSHFLNNTQELYRLADGTHLTELGLWNHLTDIGYLGDFEPLTGGLVTSGGYHTWNPLAVTRNLRYMANTVNQYNGWGKLMQELGLGASAGLDQATYGIKWANNWLDQAGRFALVTSTASARNLGDIPRAVLSQAVKKHETVEEAVEWAKNFYFQYDDITKTDKFLSNHVIPFWGFHAKNIPAAVRFVARNPTRYMAYQRLYALANRPVATDSDSMLTEGTVQPWLLQQQSIYFRTSQGYFAVPMGSLDPIGSGLQWVTDPAQAVLSSFGLFPNAQAKATSDRIGNFPGQTQTSSALMNMLQNSFPMYKAIVETVSNQDDFGRPLDEGSRVTTFLGYRMPPVQRLWLESMLPILGTLNRANPGQVFGTPTMRNASDGSWTPGTPSRMLGSGNAPRSDKDNFQTNNPYARLSITGVKVYPVDVYLNAGYTYDSLHATVQGTKRFRQSLETGLLQLDPKSDAYAQQQAKIAEVDTLIQATVEDMNRLDDWATQHGFNARQAVSKLQETNRRIGDLPPVIQSNKERSPVTP